MSLSANQMAVEAEENQETPKIPAQSEQPGELEMPGWSVISFEAVAVSNLRYGEAVELMNELRRQKISGLCIITDEAAARFAK